MEKKEKWYQVIKVCDLVKMERRLASLHIQNRPAETLAIPGRKKKQGHP